MTLAEVEAVMDEDLPQETPVEPAAMSPDDPALIVFTSGTTGEPRAAVHGYRYIAGQRLQAEHWLGAQPGDLVWCTTSTGWAKSARNVFLAPWLMGAAATIHDARFEAAERLDLIEELGVNVLCQAPTDTGCSPSARACGRCRRCGGWSRRASRSTPRSSTSSAA